MPSVLITGVSSGSRACVNLYVTRGWAVSGTKRSDALLSNAGFV